MNHNPGFEKLKPGPDGLKPIILEIRKGFPDLKYIIEKVIVTDDYVAAYVIITGTHTGDFFGVLPTGKKIKVYQMQFERIANGKMIEHWCVTDDLSLMKQLGQIK
ncbi:MAG: ester cyclase [Methylococcaceae bacterium]|nr:ester cyclase [Methylococcaceae bacterium]